MKKTFHITTFGCQMNEHDSEVMAGMLLEKGFDQVKERKDVLVKITLDAFIPDGYIPTSEERISYYVKISSISSREEIASIFEEIGIVEMMHLDMLMHAITEFGGSPEYNDSQRNSFNSNFVNYTTKLSEMLENNIQGESLAIENYKQAIMRVDNESLKQLFARIIEDEEQHIKVFKKIRDSVRFLSI